MADDNRYLTKSTANIFLNIIDGLQSVKFINIDILLYSFALTSVIDLVTFVVKN